MGIYLIDRIFLYGLVAVVFKEVIESVYWWTPLLMFPLIIWDLIDDIKLKKDKGNE